MQMQHDQITTQDQELVVRSHKISQLQVKTLLEAHGMITSGISGGISISKASSGSVRRVCPRSGTSNSGDSTHLRGR